MRVTGLGQCSLDHIAVLKRFPQEDTKEEALGLAMQGGGPVATALVALSRLGVKTSFIGMVSDDAIGAEIRRGLKAEGVDVKGLKVKKGGSSQAAFILVNPAKSSRTIIWKRPTVPPLGPKEIDLSLIRGSDLLLLDGLMAGASLEAARTARLLGIPVMLDAGRMRPGMMKLCSLADYIVASSEFAAGLGPGTIEAIEKLSSYNPKAVTITLGKKGSVTSFNGKLFRQKAFKVKAVDTTGAGDVFHAGYIYGLLKNWAIEKTVEFASAFAALKCLKAGGRAGIPTLSRTLKFMKDPAARR
ncbi:MAG: sugar kinase [Deltaproteobacteria bacterium]|nr:sugar kinase [Deltaproteobacteria bacterium]